MKFGKKIIKLPKKADDTKYTAEDFKDISLDEVKKMIEAEMPGAFTKKEKKAAKKTGKKKKK
jgi:DNA topoisomerase-1